MLQVAAVAGPVPREPIFSNPPFEYYAQSTEFEVVRKLDGALRERLFSMAESIGGNIPDRIRVFLPLSRAGFGQLTGGRVPGWAGGVAYPEEGRIVIKAPVFFQEGVSLDELAAHETAHILLRNTANGAELPRWMNEGLCQVLSGESRSGSLARLGRAALADRLMGLPQVEDVLSFNEIDADLAYAESRDAANEFVQRFGWEGVRSILRQLAQGAEFDEAFETATGREYEAWQADWMESAQTRYRRFIWLDAEDFIWTFIVLLMIVAVMVNWIRTRIQFKRWLEEEDDESENEQGDSSEPTVDHTDPVDDHSVGEGERRNP